MFFAILFLALFLSLPVVAQTPDWPAVREEALATLADLVKLDTSQPKGNEIIAARYLKEKLDKEGIPSEIFESLPTRANIVARVKGNGKKRPLLLLGHLDVVAVERAEWSFDPFGGVIKDGILYGRGSGDDKGVVVGAFQTLVLLHRLKVPLDRDVIFLGAADEEHGSDHGIDFMLAKHRDKIDAEFAVNEGGSGVFDRNFEYTRFEVQSAEKVPRRIDLKAKGTSGHGSVPRLDNPIGTLARAVAKLFEYETPVELNDTTREYFKRLAENSPPDQAALFRDLLTGNPSEETQAKLRELSPVYYSMIRTSIVPTIFNGGYLRNVIPSEAEATVDIRAMPSEDPEELFSRLKRIMNEPNVDLVPHPVTRKAHQPSPLDSELFLAFEKVLKQRYPKALVLPRMSTGATDSAQLRAAGIQSYGFGPARGEWDLSGGIHGKDEYIHVKGFQDYVETLYDVTLTVAGAK